MNFKDTTASLFDGDHVTTRTSSAQAKKRGHHRAERHTLPISKLFVEQTYGHQRPLNQNWVDERRDLFEPSKLREIVVSARKEGTFAILDGQHRTALASINGVRKLACDVRYGLTLAEEAALFLALNDARPVTKTAKFSGRFAAGESKVRDIYNIVEEAGFSIGKTGKHNISNATTVEHVYDELGRDVFQRTIITIKHCWLDYRVTGVAVAAVAFVLAAAGGSLDEKAFRALLLKNGPAKIDNDLTETMGGVKLRTDHKPMALARLLLRAYNKKRKKKIEETRLKARANTTWARWPEA